MPIYEYRCDMCHKPQSFFIRSLNRIPILRCRFCESEALSRLMSRVATPKGDERRLDRLADPSAISGVDESDPKSMARWMKKMAGEIGEDMDDALLEEMEASSDESHTDSDVEPPPM